MSYESRFYKVIITIKWKALFQLISFSMLPPRNSVYTFAISFLMIIRYRKVLTVMKLLYYISIILCQTTDKYCFQSGFFWKAWRDASCSYQTSGFFLQTLWLQKKCLVWYPIITIKQSWDIETFLTLFTWI